MFTKGVQRMINNIGSWAMPIIISMILLGGILKNVPLFDTFLKGAKEGLNTSVLIAPSLIGLITAVSMLKASGALDIFTSFISPLAIRIGLPPEIVPLAILRPISGSGSIALLDNIFENYGPDSEIGRISSIIMGATETTFYTAAIYLGAAGIKNSRHTIPSALIADITTIIFAIITTKLFLL